MGKVLTFSGFPMCHNIVRIAMKKKISFDYYNLLEYKESLGEIFYIGNFKILWLLL